MFGLPPGAEAVTPDGADFSCLSSFAMFTSWLDGAAPGVSWELVDRIACLDFLS